jgi:predicted Zn-dependent peptidase
LVQKHILKNGVTILTDYIRQTDVISVGFWFLIGSRDEADSEIGMAHFLEHMLFKGTEKRNAFQIAQTIDRVGGILNGFTEKEYTCYYCTLPNKYLHLALDVLADMVFHSRLDKKEIEKEKLVIINEIQSMKDTPEEMVHEHYLKNLWGSHPLARGIAGEIKDVMKITKEKLLSYYKDNYTMSNLIISIAGNFNHTALLDAIEKVIARNSQRKQAPALKRFVPERIPSWKYEQEKFYQVHILTGTELKSEKKSLKKYYQSMIFSKATGESMSSRLFQEIREKRALCYNITSFKSIYSDICLWMIYTNTTQKQTVELINSLNRELRRLKEDKPAKEEIEDAKSHLKGSMILAKADTEARMKRLVRIYTYFGHLIDYKQSIKYIDSVTISGVHELIELDIISDRFNLLAYGGKKINSFHNYHFNF